MPEIEKKHKSAIVFKSISSSGSSEDGFGLGKMDLSFHTPDYQTQYTTGLDFHYARKDVSQIETGNQWKDSEVRSAGIRSMSLVQANYLKDLVAKFLTEELNGVIPSDEEIIAIRSAN